jgi:hypothetical protein
VQSLHVHSGCRGLAAELSRTPPDLSSAAEPPAIRRGTAHGRHRCGLWVKRDCLVRERFLLLAGVNSPTLLRQQGEVLRGHILPRRALGALAPSASGAYSASTSTTAPPSFRKPVQRAVPAYLRPQAPILGRALPRACTGRAARCSAQQALRARQSTLERAQAACSLAGHRLGLACVGGAARSGRREPLGAGAPAGAWRHAV